MSQLLDFARLRLAARNLPVRIALAAWILRLAWWLSDRVRGLVALVDTNSARLGFEMMGIGIGLAIVAFGVAVALPGRPARRLGLGPSRLPAGALIALVLGTLGLSLAVDSALSFTRALEGSVVVGISRGVQAARGGDLVIALLGSAIAPAVGEELLCRGVLQRSLARALGPLLGVAGSALFFGWLHGELVHGAIATCLGAYMGLAAYWSDSTRPAIAAHAANNVLALLASAGLFAPSVPAVFGLFGGLGVAALGLVWAWRARNPAHPEGKPEPQKAPLQPGRGPADA